jgi:hypothetical protein
MPGFHRKGAQKTLDLAQIIQNAITSQMSLFVEVLFMLNALSVRRVWKYSIGPLHGVVYLSQT